MNRWHQSKKAYFWMGGLAVASLLASVSGCSGGGDRLGEEAAPSNEGKVDAQIVSAMNRFAINVYENVAKDNKESESGGNRMFSPAGLTFVLSMLKSGAAGETALQMEKAMQVGSHSVESWDAGQSVLMDHLRTADPSIQLKIADSLWSRKGWKLNSSYVQQMNQQYDAQVQSLDFEAANVVEVLNQWASDHTDGKITQIIDQPLPGEARLMVMNAMYFKGNWTEPFGVEMTADQSFQLAGGRHIQVPMMVQQGRYDYLDGEGFQAVRLPYGESGDMGMILALPDEDHSLEEFLKTQLPQFNTWKTQLSEMPGEIGLPRFQIQDELTLNEVLKQQGMFALFDASQADLSGLASDVGQGDLYVSYVKQNTYLDVHEKGTEAAAVTIAAVEAGAAPTKPIQTFTMKLNRPFFFAITDRKTGLILFIGEVRNPATS
ncbi:hypothetical protein B9G55_02590 [Saccharibacillus sp. O16]|nr:hypothetical protein B9G55_02590 [Saccharibacillus sp. O16]